jgi:glycosyltransferase involved in cell wall biosynthesis
MVLTLLRRFDHRQMKHVVITLREAGELADRLPAQVACCALGLRHRDRLGFVKLRSALRHYGARIVHARNTGCWADTLLACIFFRQAQPVLGFHGFEDDRSPGRWRRLAAQYARFRRLWFTSVSQRGQQDLHGAFGTGPERIVILPNGVEFDIHRRVSDDQRRQIRHVLGVRPNEFVIGIVGSLTRVKGHDLLLKALGGLKASGPAFKLVIIGDGPERDRLANLATTLGVSERVLFAGWREDVASCLQGMDAYVCASRSEGMSNALLEAMAAGLPVIATDVADHAVIFRGGQDALLIPADDTAALSRALECLLGDRQLRRRLGRAASERAQCHSLVESVAAYQSLYGDLAGNHGRRIATGSRRARALLPDSDRAVSGRRACSLPEASDVR